MVKALQDVQKETLKICNRLWGLSELFDKVGEGGEELSDMMPTFLADHLESLAEDLNEINVKIMRLEKRVERGDV